MAICTEWKQFRVADFAWLKANLLSPVIVDGRNLYDPEQLRRHGLLYYAVGRGDFRWPPVSSGSTGDI